ncbi:tubulin binding [Methylorubrum populi]|uniref:Tubulin binding n=1 Tax=Methylorubrum populi TaxID=223967 RepID=A0A160PBB0_9HYPH|nr:tubulin binding [Methylorubrum populi]
MSEAQILWSRGIERIGDETSREEGPRLGPAGPHDKPLSKHRQPEADQDETEDQKDTGQGFGVRRACAEVVCLGRQPDSGDKAERARDHQHGRFRRSRPTRPAFTASDRVRDGGHRADDVNMAFGIGSGPGPCARAGNGTT